MGDESPSWDGDVTLTIVIIVAAVALGWFPLFLVVSLFLHGKIRFQSYAEKRGWVIPFRSYAEKRGWVAPVPKEETPLTPLAQVQKQPDISTLPPAQREIPLYAGREYKPPPTWDSSATDRWKMGLTGDPLGTLPVNSPPRSTYSSFPHLTPMPSRSNSNRSASTMHSGAMQCRANTTWATAARLPGSSAGGSGSSSQLRRTISREPPRIIPGELKSEEPTSPERSSAESAVSSPLSSVPEEPIEEPIVAPKSTQRILVV
ncbi:hypothetical protein B0H66DRAFT_639425 [Apodospora peruviana]|uniref:Uncharacterized protein n=1 Tax=Apodospora peruviana TaxID=516989 RepID=A0AAE0M4W1_9PEZI|nr:hypothetical protein B0H66DRAFT_639425 [Apodospora peruviana]